MTEPKRIHRFPPCSAYDIPRTQAWIEDMAAKGWHLEKDSYAFGTFSFLQGEPKKIRCRLEATDTNGGMFSANREPTPEARKLYRELGWDWMDRRGQFQIYITEDPTAPELHTDPRIQAMTIKSLTKFLRNELGNMLFLFVIQFFLLWRVDVPLYIAAAGFWTIFLCVIWLLSIPVSRLWNVIRFYRMRKQLEQGDVPEQRKEYASRRWTRLISPIFTVLLWVSFFHTTAVQYARPTDFDRWQEPLPFATLEEIFPDAELDHENQILDSYVISSGDWFTPVNTEMLEYADVTLADGTHLNGYLYILYHETKYDWFAMDLAQAHVDRVTGAVLDRFFVEETEVTELTGGDWDYAATWNDIYPYVLVCRDNIVIQARYSTDIAAIFTPEEFAQLLLNSTAR